MLVLLALVLAGLAAAYFATRDDKKGSNSATVTTTLAQTVAPAPAQTTVPKPKAAAPARAAVPRLVGTPAPAALQTLKKLELTGTTRGVFSTKPRNQVVSQKPAAATTIARGAVVTLNVSKGPKATPATVTVPDLVGKKLLAARKLIREAGLVTEFKRVPSEEPKGTVVSQSPKPGTTAKRGAHVLVNVSQGPKPQQGVQPVVPDVTGQDEATATQDLQAAGYQVEVVSQDASDPAEDGVVVNQNPPAGQQAPAKSTVTIYVGRFSS